MAVGCGWGPTETAAVDDAIVVGADPVRVDVIANDRIAEGDEVVTLRVPGGPTGVEVDGLVLVVGPYDVLDRTTFDYEIETDAGDRSSATVRVTEGASAAAPPADDPAADQPPEQEPADDPPPPEEPEAGLADLVVEVRQLGPAPGDAVEYSVLVSNVGAGEAPPVEVAVAAGGATSVVGVPAIGGGEVFGLGGVLDTDPAPGIELVAEVDVQALAAEADEGNNTAVVPIDYVPRGTIIGPGFLYAEPADWQYEFAVDAHDPDGGSVVVEWTAEGGGFDHQVDREDGSVGLFGDDPTCGDLLVVTADLVDDEGSRVSLSTSVEIETCDEETAPIL